MEEPFSLADVRGSSLVTALDNSSKKNVKGGVMIDQGPDTDLRSDVLACQWPTNSPIDCEF